MEVVQRQPDLLEIILALDAGGGLRDLLNGRQQQAHQDGDDRNHHQHLDECEPTSTAGAKHS